MTRVAGQLLNKHVSKISTTLLKLHYPKNSCDWGSICSFFVNINIFN